MEMKKIDESQTYLSPCGINCEVCGYKDECGETCHNIKGKPCYIKDFGINVCPMYDCAVNKKGYKTCGECPELPCKTYYDWKDLSMTDEEYIKSINDRVSTLKAST